MGLPRSIEKTLSRPVISAHSYPTAELTMPLVVRVHVLLVQEQLRYCARMSRRNLTLRPPLLILMLGHILCR